MGKSDGDELYAKADPTKGDNRQLTVDKVILRQESDDLVLMEGGGGTIGGPEVIQQQVSVEGGHRQPMGGDPAVTGGGVGDPHITKGGKMDVNDKDSSSDSDGNVLYEKGRKGKSRGGPKDKVEQESESEDDQGDEMYLKGKNKGKSRGGPKEKVQQGQENESDDDQGDDMYLKGNKGPSKGGPSSKKKEEAKGVKYGDPVVTAMEQEADHSESDEDDEFDDNENYQV